MYLSVSCAFVDVSGIWDKLEHSFINIHNKTKHLRTVTMNKETNAMPIVLVHGMGAGVGLWVLNYEELAKNRPVRSRQDFVPFTRLKNSRIEE